MNTNAAPKSDARFFKPRRLGHANVFVSNYERIFDYYHSVVGFEEVYRQPDNRASFISNGNTYHDFALTDVTSKYARGEQKPGLMHIAFELENEVELVEGYQRATANGVQFRMTLDHDVAHSLYMTDPDGNGVELYADVVEDWRAVRHGVFAKAKPQWIPGVTTQPIREARYPKNPEIRVVADSVFRARRTTHVAFVARDFEAMFDYYTRIIGLEPFAGGRNSAFAALGGTANRGVAVSLLRPAPGLTPSLHHVGIEVREADLARALTLLAERGVRVERDIDHPARRAVTIADPDGLRLQFYFNRDWAPARIEPLAIEDAAYLL